MAKEELFARLNDREYKNWLKAGRCLLILKTGLHPFTTQHMRDFHKDLLTHNSVLQRPCDTDSCRARGNKFSSACRGCAEWQTEILKHHRQPGTTVNWDNCFPPSWRTDYWEVAKAYMPRGQGKVKAADQCDASALLNLINFCDCFQSVDPKCVREVIRCRNELMHSCELHIKDEWMRRYQKTLKHFVQQFRHEPNMATVEREINKMLTVDLSVYVSGLDEMDNVRFHSAIWTPPEPQGTNIESFRHWEAELLRERLKELLYAAADDDAKTQDSEQLKSLGGFLEANRDLSARLSAELQTINLLQDRK